MKEFIGIRLDDEQIQLIDAIAAKEDRSRAAVVRVLIKEAIEVRESKKERVPA